MYARTEDRDTATTWVTREAQYEAVCTWGIPDHALLQRLSGLKLPVFVANGDSDPMILPQYSYLLAGLIPQAQVKIYPDSAHGFLFQHHTEFAADVEAFPRLVRRYHDHVEGGPERSSNLRSGWNEMIAPGGRGLRRSRGSARGHLRGR